MSEYRIDETLAKFYQVDNVADLIEEMEAHILKLIDTHRRNVKPWEDTFPPTLMPKHIREQGYILNKDALALAQKWQDKAADSWGEDKDDAARQACCDELRALVDPGAAHQQANRRE